MLKTVLFLPIGIKDKNDPRIARVINGFISGGAEVLMTSALAPDGDDGKKVKICGEDQTPVDLVVSMGGDGSMLFAAHEALKWDAPVLGINTGTVGYMAELPYERIDIIPELIAGDLVTEERMMLSAEISVGDEIVHSSPASLNDIVITKSNASGVAPIELYCHGADAGKYDSDGVVFATPTGSTAYSLSAGGPLIDPSMSCICVTPLCPHSVLARPAIYSGDSVIRCRAGDWRRSSLLFIADGGDPVAIPDGAVVTIRKSIHISKFVRFGESGFVGVFRAKMGR